MIFLKFLQIQKESEADFYLMANLSILERINGSDLEVGPHKFQKII